MAAICWGMLGPVSRFAFQHNITALEVAFWRSLLGGVFFLVEMYKNNEFKIKENNYIHLIIFSIFGVAGLETTNLIAVQESGAAFASILLYSAPIWVAIISCIWFKEKLSKKKIFALIITFVGVCGFALYGNSISNQIKIFGIVCGLISGISYALFYIYGKYIFIKNKTATVYSYAFLIASIVIVPFVEFKSKLLADWLILLFLGLISTYAAYWFYAFSLKKMNPVRASIILMLEPIFSTIFSYILWGEKFSMQGWIFAGIILTGVFTAAFLDLDQTNP